jgi:hypothetical protein
MHAIGGEKRERILVCEVDLSRGKMISKLLPKTREGEGGLGRSLTVSIMSCSVLGTTTTFATGVLRLDQRATAASKALDPSR